MRDLDASSPEHERKTGPEKFFGCPLRKAGADEWALVLIARGIPSRITAYGNRFFLEVPRELEQVGADELEKYQEENTAWHADSCEILSADGVESTLWILLVLTVVFSLAFLDGWREILIRAGSGHTGSIGSGQWWRLATALTLHGGPGHLLGNMFFGGVVMVGLSMRLGNGLAWFAVLMSGVIGNLMNYFLHEGNYSFIGSSTAVFGALGLITGCRVVSLFPGSFKAAFLPVAAGLGLLALLGSHGENVDIGAHLFGFVSGLASGCAIGAMERWRGPAGRRVQRMAGIAAAVIPAACWILALKTVSR